jgi:hypothetical protein
MRKGMGVVVGQPAIERAGNRAKAPIEGWKNHPVPPDTPVIVLPLNAYIDAMDALHAAHLIASGGGDASEDILVAQAVLQYFRRKVAEERARRAAENADVL